MINYKHAQITPYLITYYFDTYEDALNALRYYWKNDRKFYYQLDSYYDHDRKKYYGSFKCKIFSNYRNEWDSKPYEYYISWRPKL